LRVAAWLEPPAMNRERSCIATGKRSTCALGSRSGRVNGGVLGVCAEAECLRSRREDGAGLWREETSALRRIPSGEFLDSVVSLRDEGGRVLRDAAFVDSVVSLLFSSIHVDPAAGNASYRASYRLATRSRELSCEQLGHVQGFRVGQVTDLVAAACAAGDHPRPLGQGLDRLHQRRRHRPR